MTNRKMVHLNTEMLTRLIKIKHSMIWAWICSEERPVSVLEIQKQYPQLSIRVITNTLKKLLDATAIKKSNSEYLSNPDFYYTSN